MAVPSNSIGNGLQLEVADCDENSISQQFNKDGGKFSTHLNGNMVIDASSTNSGDPIVLWESNGGDNQKWRAGLN